MTKARSETTTPPALRLWPGVAAVALLWLFRFGLPLVAPSALSIGLLGAMVCALLVVVWWLFLSRAAWLDRLGGLALMILAFLAAKPFLDESIATAAGGMLYPLYVVPPLCLAFVFAVVASRRLPVPARRGVVAALVLLSGAAWALVRTEGVSGGFDWDFSWRWSTTPEERLLARAANDPARPDSGALPGETPAEWPGFRGPDRDGVARGPRLATDWKASPPIELWRRPIGPGWSSFAVHGDLLYTQEQRGEEEVVSCYRASTGEPVWRHGDPVRFWEAMAGAGPRSTPTLSQGRVYALGATGVLNGLDAHDGSVLWTRDVVADFGAQRPGWGFAGSPLVTGENVVVAAAGQLAAYDRTTGEMRWTGSAGAEGYVSPHLATLGGVEQVLLLNGKGLISVSPDDGSELWTHSWPGFHSLQPALTADGGLLIANANSSAGLGIRRLAISRADAGWTVDELWTSTGLKGYFNDFVVHEGHAYGFDGRILSAIDLASGERRWKGGRYGHGQLVLLPAGDLLLVLSEKGELALVSATPDRFHEQSRWTAIEGKTWNHPVLVGDLLLVRNAQEMAAFRLARASR